MRSIAMLFLGTCLAQSQPPSPTPAKATQDKQQQKASESKNRNNDKQATQESPPSTPKGNSAPPAEVSTNSADNRKNPTSPELIVWFTGVLAAVAVIQVIVYMVQAHYMRRGLEETEKAANAARDSIVLAQRPKIIVRRFSAYSTKLLNRSGPAHFEATIDIKEISNFGTFMIANIGGTKAIINDVFSEVRVLQYLPRIPPYEGKHVETDAITLLAGQACHIDFPSVAINVAEDLAGMGYDHPFYVMGRIEYADELGNIRTMAFCRRWSKQMARFEPVDDQDYEYAD